MIRFRIATLGTIDEVWKDQTVDVAKIATVERDRLSSALEPILHFPRGTRPTPLMRITKTHPIRRGRTRRTQSPSIEL